MHAVGVPFDAGHVLCLSPKQTFRVRAILSWNNPPLPDNPGFLPVWGNVAETTYTILPRLGRRLPAIFLV